MGYSSRDNLHQIVEEKKDDGSQNDHQLSNSSLDDEKRVADNDVISPLTDTNSNVANEPSDMQQDPVEPSTQQQPQPQSMIAQDTQASQLLLAQQLLLNANVSHHQHTNHHQQQTQLMTNSLNSLQLNTAAAAQQPVVTIPSVALGNAISAGQVTPPVNPLSAQIIQQQMVLAQQQAAAQIAALHSITSAQTAGVQPVPQLLSPSVLPASLSQGAPNVLSPFTQQTTTQQMVYPQQLQQTALGVEVANPTIASSLLAAASAIGSNTPSIIPPSTLAVNTIPSTAATSLSPQMTIPHYVPPIPATWGAQLPTLSVQDRPLVPPVYNGINPNYPGAQLLHAHPPIFVVDNFLNSAECDFLIENANDAFGPAPVVGKGSGEVSPSRTSSTCYLAREDLPEYLRKISLLTGKPAEHCELPQVGRYYPNQQYLQHFDAFDLSNDDGRRFAANGGQRTVTVLVYLNDVPRGGATSFPSLNIKVQPRRGMALVFFPSTLDGLLDKMVLHAAEPAVDIKYVSQVWIRQSNYEGTPSKRLAEPLTGLLERKLLLQQQLHHQAAQHLQAVQLQQQQVAAQIQQHQNQNDQQQQGAFQQQQQME